MSDVFYIKLLKSLKILVLYMYACVMYVHVFIDSLLRLCMVCCFTVLCQVCKHLEIECDS